MSERDEDGRYVPDDDERAADLAASRARWRACQCDIGVAGRSCPGPANCPYSGEGYDEDEGGGDEEGGECKVCFGVGWECYGTGAGDPHFRECGACHNPEGLRCP